MRKKSHISLAGQIMDSMELDNVFDYRLPFYVGSIWPDCRPSFVTTPHKFDITFDDIERKISKFIATLCRSWCDHSLHCRLFYIPT